ncbi:Acyl-CoA synthetase (AMP-forming)/AMP-acid ligase II [Selenomonas sp. WCT3]|uniref:AMP-binding protein n=1 Tax=Selenomonas sp. WCT3 TaxID=3158785 RepID=UPI0008868E69|nr:Acyl-CoA synthetase (AMP-forming)/AMP-acid ligase II [Selenomonas ruminantium]
MNYYTLLQHGASRQPEKLFLVVDGEEWSYQRFLRLVRQLTGQLAERLPQGLAGADVLLLADTFAGQLAGFLALQAVKMRPILLHHGLSPGEVQEILRENRLQGLLTLSVKSDKSAFDQSKFDLSWEENACERVRHEAPDILGVLSSGTTGAPKVMYRTYESWAGFFPVQNSIFHVGHDSRLFLQGSLSFTGNLNSLLAVLYEGGSIITSETMHCRRWGKLIRGWAVDVIYLIPTKLQLLAAALKEPLPDVQSLFTGSQLLSARNICDLQRLLPQAQLLLYYGASELNYISYAICADPGRDSRNLGRPFPGIGVTVHDGLIYVDTPYHVSGAKIPFTVKDTGYLNEKGELIFEGRRDAWVNKGGVKISILRVENELQAVVGIREAVVLPCADKLRGSTLAAFIVRDEGAEESALRRAIRKSLKPVEVPSVLCFLSQMPLNDRGKVNRRALREKLENYLTISENNSKISVS